MYTDSDNSYRTQLNELLEWIKDSQDSDKSRNRPFITLTYAQSLDGSIAAMDKTQLTLSGEESFTLTHELRSLHSSILVGIKTVMADNPRLTVRLVPGNNPTPVILDTHGKISPDAKVFQEQERNVLIVGSRKSGPFDTFYTTNNGYKKLYCETEESGLLDLNHLMSLLQNQNIESVMVEGGARVISNFLSAGLVDCLLLTISPRLVGGYNALSHYGLSQLGFKKSHFLSVGEDIVFWGCPEWKTA
mgnify:CR=1 FL=1